jgi:hypothetical protein
MKSARRELDNLDSTVASQQSEIHRLKEEVFSVLADEWINTVFELIIYSRVLIASG